MPPMEKLLDLLKLKTRHAFALCLVSGAILLAPYRVLQAVGLLGYREAGKPYFAGAFLVSAVLLIAALYQVVQRKLSDYFFLRAGKKRFALLTAEEKQILRGYLEGATRTQYLSIQSGVVQGLVHDHIIYRSANLSTYGTLFAYNIQPWAWNYLNEHRDLLMPREAPDA